MKYVILLLLLVSKVFGQGVYLQQAQHNRLPGVDVFTDHRQIKITNFATNGVSYNYPASSYFDGDLTTKRSPNQGIYYPDTVHANMAGIFEIESVDIYGPSSNATLKIIHSNNAMDWTYDTIINLNYSGALKVKLHNIQCRFLGFVLNANQGPTEIKIFSKNISFDTIPARVFRPYRSFRHLTGFNSNFSIPHSLYPWDSVLVRWYDYTYKLMYRNSDTIFAFSPDFFQYILLDDYFAQVKADKLILVPLFHQTPDSLFKDSYVNAGQDFNYNSRAIKYGTDPYNPASWISKSRLAYQFAARYGDSTHQLSDLKIDLTWNYPYDINEKLSGLDVSEYFEPDNERISWFNGPDPNKFDLPKMVAAEGSALLDGHENTMGPRVGLRGGAKKMKLVLGALADRDLDAIKQMYYWYQKNRTDKKFAYDVINFHEYETDHGGFDDFNSRAIHPEAFTVRGYNFVGAKGALNYFTDWIHRYIPGKEIMYSEWGFDACRNSPVGVKLPTTAERALQVHPLNSWQKQGAFTIRMMLEMMSVPYIDRSVIYEIFNEIGFSRIDGELPDDVSDGPGNNVPDYYSIYGGAIRYQTSGHVLCQFGYKPAVSTTAVNLSSVTNGTILTFNLKNHLPKTFSSPIHIRADEDTGTEQNAETVDGTIISQNDSVVVISVTGHTGTGTRTNWRFDAPFLKKPAWYMTNNAMAVIGDCKFIADSSTSEYRRYIIGNAHRTAEVIWLPTNDGNEITRTIKTSMPSATFKNLESYTGATSSISISSGQYSTSIYEVPKIFYYDH